MGMMGEKETESYLLSDLVGFKPLFVGKGKQINSLVKVEFHDVFSSIWGCCDVNTYFRLQPLIYMARSGNIATMSLARALRTVCHNGPSHSHIPIRFFDNLSMKQHFPIFALVV